MIIHWLDHKTCYKVLEEVEGVFGFVGYKLQVAFLIFQIVDLILLTLIPLAVLDLVLALIKIHYSLPEWLEHGNIHCLQHTIYRRKKKIELFIRF